MTWFPWGIYTAVGLLGGGCSVAQLCPTLCNPKVHSGPQNAGLPCPSPYPRVCSKLMSIELVMPSNHLILCCPLLLLPSIFCGIKFFSNESALHIRGQSIGASASASVLPRNIQSCFPLGLTGLIPLLSKRLPRVFIEIK